jgi:hypothetical protein
MTQTQSTPRFSTYSAYAKNWLIENEIKLKTVYINDGNYNPHFIYIARIGSCNKHKAKFRVLKPGELVKNCIMVTFNTERHDKAYLAYLITSKLPVLRQIANGSCQSFLTQDHVARVLSGAVNNRGFGVKEVLY